MVELGVAIPLLLLVATGILTFGISLSNYLMLTQATGVGARQLAISRGQTTDPCSTVATAVIGAAPLLRSANLTYAYLLNGVPYTGISCLSSSISTGAAANLLQGTPAKVTVTYPCQLVWFKSNIFPGCTLTSQVTEEIQ